MILTYRRLILNGDAMRLALHLDLACGVKIAMIRLEQQAPQCSRPALELGTIPIDARINFRYFPTQAPTLAPAIKHALMSLKKQDYNFFQKNKDCSCFQQKDCV
jgi:hypothetical protein